MTKLTTERLERKIKNCIEIEDCQVMLPLSAAEELLAFREAAKNPVAFTEACEISNMNATGLYMRGFPDSKQGRNIPIYAAPVLTKQPELVVLTDEQIDAVLDSNANMAYIISDKRERLRMFAREIIRTAMISTAPAQPVIPEQPKPTISFYLDGIIAAAQWVEKQREAYDNEHGQHDGDTGFFEFGNDAQRDYSETLAEIAEGIRSLHPATAQPVSEPYKLNGWISVDNELPEEGAHVLVFSDGAFVLLAEFTGGEFYDVARDGGEFFETVTRCVTHWMPLPAAPAQESE